MNKNVLFRNENINSFISLNRDEKGFSSFFFIKIMDIFNFVDESRRFLNEYYESAVYGL